MPRGSLFPYVDITTNRLFAQYGGVVLQTQVTEGVVRTFTRASAEETLNQVIDDLQNAYDKLPTDRWRGTGTWTKYTAAHFLAKDFAVPSV